MRATQEKTRIKAAVFVTGNRGYGVQKSLLTQCKAAPDYAIDFEYICIGRGELHDKLLGMGADVKLIEMSLPIGYPPNLLKLSYVVLGLLFKGFKLYRLMKSHLKKNPPDIVYVHSVTEHCLGGLAAKSCDIKSIGHFRGQMNVKRNWGLSRKILSWMLSRCLDRAIAVSDAVRQSLWGPLKEKTHVIYNSIDTQVVQRKIAEAQNNDPIDIISVGELIDIKKQHVLIEALNILAKRDLKPNLTLVGGPGRKDTTYYNRVKDLVSQFNLSKQVHFAGFIKEPYDLIHNAKISVLCCTIEGCPNVVMESMACRTPVVVADAGGAGELIEDGITGLKCHPDSPESLANCLQRLLEDKNLRRELSENAYKKACDLFTVDAHMQNLKREFVSLLNQT